MVTTTTEPTIHYDDKYMHMITCMCVMVWHLMSQHQTSSQQQLQHIKLFLDCCHQFCKATYDETITPFWLPKGNYVTILNLPWQIEQFGPMQDFWEGSQEFSNQLVKQKTQTFISGKLTELHQSNVLDWIMHNLDPPVAASNMPCTGLFHTCARRAMIVDNFMNRKIISSYHHLWYLKHVIVAYCQADKCWD